MAGDITVSERILYHLSNYVKHEDKYESPFDVTQDGISQACAISRAHAAIELKKLKAAGIVDERLAHVRRGKTRRKVYFLTFSGKSKAADVLQYVKNNGIVPGVDASKVTPELPQKAKGAKRSTPLPTLRGFYGRDRELASVKESLSSGRSRILSIRGIAGIGKTTLAAKACSELSGYRIFWYSAKPWDSPKSLSDALGIFFLDNGAKKLSAFLSSGKSGLSELSFLLNEELSENGYLFVFDDIDVASGLGDFLKMFRHSSGSAKMMVTSESQPIFYEPSDVVAKNEVMEMELEGLDKQAALELLRSRGIEGSVAEELARVTNGHPLSLEMVTQPGQIEAKYQVSKFFEDKFYSGLGESEKALLQLSSVFQKPFPTDAIPKELRQARKGSMLREVMPGRFEIHSSLRGSVYDLMTKEERIKWHSSAADYYLRCGDQQERLYHLIRANRLLEAEMTMARQGEELLSVGNIQRLWAVLSDFVPSKPKYAQAVNLLKARTASLVGEYDSALSLLEKGASEVGGAVRADALIEMGKIKSKQGDLKIALKLFTEALEQAGNSPALRARALRGLGVVENKIGDYSKAQELLERSAVDSMSAMDSKGMLLAHMELGNVFIGRGMYEKAIEHFSKCAVGFGPVELANVYINMGIACAYLNRTQEAKLNLENAVRLADETGQPRTKAYALTSLSEVMIRTGSIESAKELCFSALAILTEIDDKLAVSAAYANLGLAERTSGNYAASEEYLRESISTLAGMEVPRSLGLRKMEYGLMLKESGQLKRSLEMLEDSRNLLASIHANDLVARIDRELLDLRK
ncbi:MAG: hypothetical protein A3K60_07740 [Euryarchaeota archaeon RBG_19FT_COMBO_56_21]|nr:MAG: hypothetical protein A3K60_07740 [Euryarchaeota archaeon RBG_19FT_COMBO_56_21]